MSETTLRQLLACPSWIPWKGGRKSSSLRDDDDLVQNRDFLIS
jgi:hypothetical protein